MYSLKTIQTTIGDFLQISKGFVPYSNKHRGLRKFCANVQIFAWVKIYHAHSPNFAICGNCTATTELKCNHKNNGLKHLPSKIPFPSFYHFN